MNVLAVIIFAGICIVGFTLFFGWVWMLALGVLAQIFHNPDLAINYWQSVILALFVNMLFGVITARLRKNQ